MTAKPNTVLLLFKIKESLTHKVFNSGVDSSLLPSNTDCYIEDETFNSKLIFKLVNNDNRLWLCRSWGDIPKEVKVERMKSDITAKTKLHSFYPFDWSTKQHHKLLLQAKSANSSEILSPFVHDHAAGPYFQTAGGDVFRYTDLISRIGNPNWYRSSTGQVSNSKLFSRLRLTKHQFDPDRNAVWGYLSKSKVSSYFQSYKRDYGVLKVCKKFASGVCYTWADTAKRLRGRASTFDPKIFFKNKLLAENYIKHRTDLLTRKINQAGMF